METRKVDVAVIGAGTAGLGARREAEKQGAEVVLIESGPYGTTCARVGCMPSKLLIAAAERAHEIAGAERFGLELSAAPRVDGAAVLARVRRERDRFVGFVVRDTEALPVEQRLRGRARFVGPTSLRVGDGVRVEARAVVVATGTRPQLPPELDAVRERVLVNDDVFELDELPGSVAVLGLGIIGLELGQALHRLGVRVRLFGRSGRVGPCTDPVVLESVRRELGAELALHPSARVEFSPEGDRGVRLRWQAEGGGSGEEVFDHVLAAAGRVANLDALALDRAGVPLTDDGRPMLDPRTLQCGETPVFMAGDVTGARALLHEAADEGRIAGFNAARFPDVIAHRRRVPLSIVFTDPQIALVGRRHAELDPEAVAIGEVDYGDQGRARVMARNVGRVRIYARREDGVLLGAEMFGPHVEHTAHLLAWVVQLGLSVDRVLELPFYHPVLEEGLRSALRDLAARLRFAPRPCAGDLDCGPGA